MYFLEIMISGILLGSLYALAASGLSLGFGIMGIVNLAHAELIMLGAYVSFWTWSLLNLNPLVTILGSMAFLFVFCIIIYKVSIKRIIGEEQLVSLILTYGISIILWNFAQLVFGSTFRSVDYAIGSVTLFQCLFPPSTKSSLLLSSASSSACCTCF